MFPTRPFQKNLTAVIVLVWAIIVIAMYFVVHKPFDIEQAATTLFSVLDLVVVIILGSLAGGVGRAILGDLFSLSFLERACLDFAFGLGVLSLVFFSFGLLGLFTPMIAWGISIFGLIIFQRAVRRWLNDLRAGLVMAYPLSRLDKLFFFFVLFILLINLSLALAPPTRWDSLVYHLEIPQRYAEDGRISFLPDNQYAGFPGLSSMWYSWAILMHAPTSAAVFGWMVGVLAILGMAGLFSRVSEKEYFWLAPAFLLSGSSLSQSLHWAYVDWWVILFGIVSWIVLLAYLENEQGLWIVLAGVLLGFAISVKYTAGMLLVLFGFVLLVYSRRPLQEFSSRSAKSHFFNWFNLPLTGTRFRRLVIECFLLAIFAFVTVSPWLLKNYLYTGQPIYPIIAGRQSQDPWQQAFGKDPVPARAWLDDLLLPFDVTIFGVEGAQVAGKPEYSANIGPFYLALIPAVWLNWRRKSANQRKILTLFLIITTGAWFFWALLAHYANELLWPRHYFGVFPLLAILAAAGFQSFTGLRIGQVRLQSLLSSVVVLALILAAFHEWQSWVKRNPLPVLTGLESRDDYLVRELGAHYRAMQEIGQLDLNEKLLLLWEPRVFYCQGDCLTDATLDNWWYLRQAFPMRDGLKSELCRRGITHILLYQTGAEWMQKQPSIYSEQDWHALSNFLDSEVELVASINHEYSLYHLSDCSNYLVRDP